LSSRADERLRRGTGAAGLESAVGVGTSAPHDTRHPTPDPRNGRRGRFGCERTLAWHELDTHYRVVDRRADRAGGPGVRQPARVPLRGLAVVWRAGPAARLLDDPGSRGAARVRL